MVWLKGFILLVGLWFLYKTFKNLVLLAKEREEKSSSNKQNLVKCSQCQTHVPTVDTFEKDGRLFCKNCSKE